MVNVGCPVATVGVKVGPCGGLDCEGVGEHRSFAVEVIIEALPLSRGR